MFNKTSIMWAIAGLTLMVLLPSAALSECQACAGDDDTAYCVDGSVGEGCVASEDGCSFSGTGNCSGGGGKYLPHQSMLLTPAGPRSVDMINVGDEVVAIDEGGHQTNVLVTGKSKGLVTEMVRINGTMSVTKGLLFSVDGKSVVAQNLEVGDIFTSETLEKIRVESVEIINRGVRVCAIHLLAPESIVGTSPATYNRTQI